MINIAQRPQEADDQAVPGHWEGDLLIGKSNKTAIGTLVERATGYALLVHLPDGYKPEQVAPALGCRSLGRSGLLGQARLVADAGPAYAPAHDDGCTARRGSARGAPSPDRSPRREGRLPGLPRHRQASPTDRSHRAIEDRTGVRRIGVRLARQ